MIPIYGFGEQVKVNYYTVPCYLRWEKGEQSPTIIHIKNDKEGSFFYLSERKRSFEEVPGTHPVRPDNKIHRRLRRIKCNLSGIIIGRTYRAEGRVEPNGADESGHLVETGRFHVYIVAIFRDLYNKEAWPADIREVLPEDLQIDSY